MYQIAAILSLFILFITNTANAQFSFKPLKNLDEYQFKNPLNYYVNGRYNRVEGPFLNLGLNYLPPTIDALKFYGSAGWGFKNQTDKHFRYSLGVRKDLLDDNRLRIGLEAFKRVESQDDWFIDDSENSFMSLFFREDYKDYYGVDGFKFYIEHQFEQQLFNTHTIRFELSRRTFDALRKNTNWSVFGGDRNFAQNPTVTGDIIVAGDEISAKLIGELDWRDHPVITTTGWYLSAIYEQTFEDFETNGLFVTAKRYQPTFGNQRLVLSAYAGSRHGSLAAQHLMHLGGVGSLRGYDDMEFSGNRMTMFNANYLFNGDLLTKVPLADVPYFGALWSKLSLGVFLDTGLAWKTDPDDNIFQSFDRFDNFKTDVGLSLLFFEGLFRMDIANRLDRSNDDFRITFRLEYLSYFLDLVKN